MTIFKLDPPEGSIFDIIKSLKDKDPQYAISYTSNFERQEYRFKLFDKKLIDLRDYYNWALDSESSVWILICWAHTTDNHYIGDFYTLEIKDNDVAILFSLAFAEVITELYTE